MTNYLFHEVEKGRNLSYLPNSNFDNRLLTDSFHLISNTLSKGTITPVQADAYSTHPVEFYRIKWLYLVHRPEQPNGKSHHT